MVRLQIELGHTWISLKGRATLLISEQEQSKLLVGSNEREVMPPPQAKSAHIKEHLYQLVDTYGF